MLPAKTPELAYPVSIAEDGTRRAVTLQLSEKTVNQLSGHARGATMSSTRYGKDQPADDLKPYIDRLTFKGLPEIAPFDVAAGLNALKDALGRKVNVGGHL